MIVLVDGDIENSGRILYDAELPNGEIIAVYGDEITAL
jgi:hypothetical protein